MKVTLLQCTMLGLLTMGCSDPFEVDRHDLVDPRILSVRQTNIDGSIEGSDHLQVQVWNGVSQYHQNTPRVVWLDEAEQPIGEGVSFDLTDGIPATVFYEDEFGGLHRAQLELATDANAQDLQPVFYDLGDVESFALSDRLRNEGTVIVDSGATDAMRIVMTDNGQPLIDDENADGTTIQSKMRWMTVGGVGTFLERSAVETDFLRADILLDRDELVYNKAIDAQAATIFALYVDATQGNQWTWMDILYTEDTRIHHGNRWLRVDALPPTWTAGEPISARVIWDDVGQDWVLTDLERVLDRIDWEAPSCADEGAPHFQWSWLELGQCRISDIDGERIVLETH